jgi:addiction module HigA family antidote
MNKKLPLPTPGEMLREEFLQPLGITPCRLAKDICVPKTRIAAILSGVRTITADTGLRLDRYFGLSDGWWNRLQTDCDLRKAKRKLSARIAREVTPREFAAAWTVTAMSPTHPPEPSGHDAAEEQALTRLNALFAQAAEKTRQTGARLETELRARIQQRIDHDPIISRPQPNP